MKSEKKTISGVMYGKGREHIPNFFFRMMTFLMKTMDVLTNNSEKHFNTLGLKENQVVVDYGCGPARYIKNASETVGEKGKVFAVDIHPMAIDNVNRKTEKYGLKNVEAVLAEGYSCSIPDNTADVVYALDMFHMIEQPKELFSEMARIVKPNGIVLIEDGHQPRSATISKIENAGIFVISEQNKHHIVCKIQ